MAQTRDIKRRIKSIGNTKKITRAMEMVSAVKMRKAVQDVLQTRPYASLSWSTVLNLSRMATNEENLHSLLEKRQDIKKIGVILISSNRGLCGGFNAAVINKIVQYAKGTSIKADYEFITIGKKGASVHRRFGFDIVADFLKLDVAEEISEVIPMAKLVIDGFLNKKYDKVLVAYTDFVNPAKQISRIKQILPFDMAAHEEFLGIVGKEKVSKTENGVTEYIFEPSPKEVLDEMIPRLIEVQLYQALLESNAAEHSARMTAMRQATDAAGDLVDELTLFYNKARQASITREIAEISAGANALKR